MTNAGQGWLAISIDLEMDVQRRARLGQRELEAAAKRLLRQLDNEQLPATWAVADPAHSAATELLLSSPRDHEIAILGDCSWVGRGAGRTRFSRELARRVDGAHSAGITVSTLALQGVELNEHLDLLVKHRIVVLRDGEISSAPADRPAGSRWSRYGVWRPVVSCRIPCQRPWWRGGVSFALRRALVRAAHESNLAHIVIDGARLVDAGETGYSAVAALVRESQKLRARGRITPATLAQLARRMMHRHTAPPLHSILRPAA